ncbi:hypothetical protein [Clostridium kluyveri]|uniref:Uncharacterized protein n=1 Tax=Clostridium kluyveri TaxID=1534 RepID=A0A1L5FAZ2_CLOKL|nr:hypothetical protein [Clostridium kluyveri]APM40169.1 hypothetical protein BS101_16185 [Clostridium kluyveri]
MVYNYPYYNIKKCKRYKEYKRCNECEEYITCKDIKQCKKNKYKYILRELEELYEKNMFKSYSSNFDDYHKYNLKFPINDIYINYIRQKNNMDPDIL